MYARAQPQTNGTFGGRLTRQSNKKTDEHCSLWQRQRFWPFLILLCGMFGFGFVCLYVCLFVCLCVCSLVQLIGWKSDCVVVVLSVCEFVRVIVWLRCLFWLSCVCACLCVSLLDWLFCLIVCLVVCCFPSFPVSFPHILLREKLQQQHQQL